jgi:prevent-host-death family protein
MDHVYTASMTTMAERAEQMQDLGIVELRNQLGRAVDEAYYRRTPVGVMRHNRRVAVIVPAELYDWWMDLVRDGAPVPPGYDSSDAGRSRRSAAGGSDAAAA